MNLEHEEAGDIIRECVQRMRRTESDPMVLAMAAVGLRTIALEFRDLTRRQMISIGAWLLSMASTPVASVIHESEPE